MMRLTDITGTRFEANIIGSMVTVFTATRPLKGLSWCVLLQRRGTHQTAEKYVYSMSVIGYNKDR